MNRYVKDIEIKCENDSLFFPPEKGGGGRYHLVYFEI